MAASSVASLVVSMELSMAKFSTDMHKVSTQTTQAMNSIQKGANLARTALGFLGVAFSAQAALSWAKDVVHAAEALGDLADSTGSTVEDLSRLNNQVKVAGGNFDDFEGALLKLTKNLGTTEDVTSDFSIALKNLGVTSKDPAKALQEIVMGMDKFANNATKAAYSKAIFDKAGVKFLATLTDMAKLQDVSATVTKEQEAEAEKLSMALRQLTVDATFFKDSILSDVVPAMNELLGVFRLARAEGVGFFQALGQAWDASSPNFDGAARLKEAYADLAEEQEKLASGNKGFFNFRPATWTSVETAGDKVRSLEAQRLRALGGGPSNAWMGPKPPLPPLPPKDIAETRRALLDQQLKDQEVIIKNEQDLLRDREQFLQMYYQDDIIDLHAFYGGRQVARDEALRNTLAAYTAEIAAIQAFANSPAIKAADRIKAQTDIAEVTAKRARVEQDAAIKTIESAHQMGRAMRDYTESVDTLNAQILQLTGNERAAAEIRFRISNRSLRDKFAAAGDTASLANLDTLLAQQLAQVDLDKAAQNYGRTMTNLGIEQARISLAQQSGNITELDAINKRSALARSYIGVLQEQVAAQEAIAETLSGTARLDALLRVKQLQLEIDSLAASANELENIFRKTFEDAFASNLTDVITGTKSLSAAFRDMERQIVASISRIASQNIAEAIFGGATSSGGGSAGGIFKMIAPWLAGVFGGGGGGLTSTGGGFGEHFASGGRAAANTPIFVGERGAELFVPHSAGTVIPNDVLTARRAQQQSVINISVNVDGATTRATADQVAVRTGAAVRRALARNT